MSTASAIAMQNALRATAPNAAPRFEIIVAGSLSLSRMMMRRNTPGAIAMALTVSSCG